MGLYDINYKKLVTLYLPTFLRTNTIIDFIYAGVSPISSLHNAFKTLMDDTKYKLAHNGQHCHLRGLLNDSFDPVQRRITLSDMLELSEPFLLYLRSENKSKKIYRRADDKAFILNRRGFGAEGFDFVINITSALNLSASDIVRLKALTDTYKLVSKRYQIIYS